MQRLKTRPQFQAAMAGGTVSRTAHFALHRLVLGADGTATTGGAVVASGASAPAAPAQPAASASPAGPGVSPQALFAMADEVWLGAMVPKRWARRAVTRNTIKRQIYTVGATFEARLPQAAHVVRLRSTFDRKQFISATSDQLKEAVRAELLQLFGYAARRSGTGTGQGGEGKGGSRSDKSPSAPRVSAVAP
ncbi:ribonuclease P protein component [Acidovorax sp.]|uniref:ribonuclease P protein component n=1 Tax=Acidovorax sp. TaxID=1872122 RepID=UPI002ACE5512|nr:ribonuclease P protein component [Acidovorax sp.]MDZ7861228.1 ribonuclease P protein component [Acidovorax sp.]